MNSKDFSILITTAFEKSGVAEFLRSKSFEFVSDTAVSTDFYNPINEFLGWDEEERRVRFGNQVKESKQALLMSNEDGWAFQAILDDAQDHRGYTYLAPTSAGNRIFTPHIPNAVRKAIASRHGLEAESLIGMDSSFWSWFESQKDIPLIITEGAKKSLALLKAGYVAISVYGCSCLGSEYLKPYLNERDVVVAMDSDGDIEKWIKVNKSVLKGCRSIEHIPFSLRVATWDSALGKGADDFLIANGSEAFDEVLMNALPLFRYDQKLTRTIRLHRWVNRNIKYSPTLELTGKYLDAEAVRNQLISVEDAWLLSVRSGLGTGKTTLLMTILDWLESQGRGRGVSVVGYRNTLLLQISERIDAYHIHEHAGMALLSDPDSRISFCVDSITRFAEDYFDDKILVLDEVTSEICHMLLSPTCAQNRTLVLERFTQAIRRASFVICLDANLSDFHLDYIRKLRDTTTTEKECRISNAQEDRNISIEVCASFGRTGLVQHIESLLPIYKAQELAVAIPCDSQKFAEKLDNLFTSKGYKVFRIDSKTTREAYVKEYIRLTHHKDFDILIYTPSCETGLNIDMEGFAHVFAFFFGVVSAASQMQMLMRVRHAAKITVQCVPYSRFDTGRDMGLGNISMEIEEILNADSDCNMDFQSAYRSWMASQRSSIHHSTYLELLDSQRFERSETIECFLRMAKVHGFHTEMIDLTEVAEIKETLKTIGSEIDSVEAQLVFNARVLSTKEALSLKSSFSASLQDHYALKKWELSESIPSVIKSDYWTQEGAVEVIKEHGSLSKMFLLANCCNLDRAKQLSAKRWSKWLLEGRFIGDTLSASLAKAKLLSEINFLNVPAEFTDETPEVKEILEKSRKIRTRIQRILGMKIGKDTPIKWLGRLFGLVGQKVILKSKNDKKRLYMVSGLNDLQLLMLEDVEKRLNDMLWDEDTESAQQVVLDPSDYLEEQLEEATEIICPQEATFQSDFVESVVLTVEEPPTEETVAAPAVLELPLEELKIDDGLSWGERASKPVQARVAYCAPVVVEVDLSDREWVLEDLSAQSDIRSFVKALSSATESELKKGLLTAKGDRRNQIIYKLEDMGIALSPA